jgi:hypothetical protein
MTRTEYTDARGGISEALRGLAAQTNLELRDIAALAHVGRLGIILDRYGIKPEYRSADPRVALRRIEKRAQAAESCCPACGYTAPDGWALAADPHSWFGQTCAHCFETMHNGADL